MTALQAELDALEAEEEAVIVEAESAGEIIVRRGDARPEIVLGEREAVAMTRSPHYMGLGDVHVAPRRRLAIPSSYVGSSRS